MLNFDHTLPIKGGWVVLQDVAPVWGTDGARLAPKPLTVIWAMPDRVSVLGSYTQSGTVYSTTKERDLKRVWKNRRGGKADDIDRFNVKAYEDWFEDYFGEPLYLEMRVRIRLPDGDMNLLPHEWKPVEDIRPYIEMANGEEAEIVELGGFKEARKFKDMMFYARSRGMSRGQAFEFVGGNVERPGVFMIETHPAIAKLFGYESDYEGEVVVEDEVQYVMEA